MGTGTPDTTDGLRRHFNQRILEAGVYGYQRHRVTGSHQLPNA